VEADSICSSGQWLSLAREYDPLGDPDSFLISPRRSIKQPATRNTLGGTSNTEPPGLDWFTLERLRALALALKRALHDRTLNR
jgi:hypothetical protein